MLKTHSLEGKNSSSIRHQVLDAKQKTSEREAFRTQRIYPRSPEEFSCFYFSEKSALDSTPWEGTLRECGAGGGIFRTQAPLNIGATIRIKLKAPTLENGASARALRHETLPKKMRLGQWIWARVLREIPATEGFPTKASDFALSFSDTGKPAYAYFINKCISWLALLSFMLVIGNVLYLKTNNITYFWYQPLINTYSVIISAYILSRFIFAYFYKPPKEMGDLPCVTVVIACKNEEASIRQTLDCIYKSDYPEELMEVISVDDGSTDHTYLEMERAQKCYPGLKLIRFEKNLGKRHGMAAGARQASGEILIYVDSDSFLRKDAIRKLVRGFADPAVGAVCGHAVVENAHKNLLTKMQEVRYFIAFRIVKAAESLFSVVSCCSGCLAAYRRSYVMEVLDIWLAQRFLGSDATFGDDRSLTNYMLKRFRVIYDAEAVCATVVPEKFRQFFKQQVRWKKSWIRESYIASQFMWMRNPIAAIFFYLGVIFPIFSPIILLNALIFPVFGYGDPSFLYVYGVFLMAMLYGLFYLIQYVNRFWLYGVLFAFFYMFVLVWQTYYALLTVNKNHWGTR